MVRPDALKNFVESRFNQLCLQYEKTYADPSPDAIHDLRVALRRASNATDFLHFLASGHGTAQETISKCQKRLRRYRKGLNPYRDLHIHLDLLEKYAEPSDPSGLNEPLRQEAEAFRVRLHAGLDSWRLPKVRRTIRRVLSGMETGGKGLDLHNQLYLKHVTLELHEALDKALPPAPFSCHQVRIRLKKYRYFLELQEQAFGIRQPLLTPVRRWQDQLGTLQDLTTLVDRLEAMDTTIEPDKHPFLPRVRTAVHEELNQCPELLEAIRFETRLP